MAKLYAMRIIDGKTTFEKVPERLKEAVATILSEEGYSNLASEGV